MYGRLMRAIGRDDLADEPRYQAAPGRLADREPLEDAIRGWMALHDAERAMATLQAAEIPAAESTTIADIFADPHYAAREAIASAHDPALGAVRMQGVTPKLSATPGAVHRAAPLLGEHNREVYGGLLGLSESAIERLRSQGVI